MRFRINLMFKSKYQGDGLFLSLEIQEGIHKCSISLDLHFDSILICLVSTNLIYKLKHLDFIIYKFDILVYKECWSIVNICFLISLVTFVTILKIPSFASVQ
jgi:hypothetical protein